MRKCVPVILAVLAFVRASGAAVEASPGVTVTPVAVFLQQAPGFPDGMFYNLINGLPSLNAEGRVLFRYSVRNAANTVYTDGWWRTDSGGQNPVLFARSRDPAPDLPGYSLGGPIAPRMGSAGEVAFASDLNRDGVSGLIGRAVVVGTPGNLRLAARSGVPMDLLGGGTFEQLQLGTYLITNGTRTIFKGWAHLNGSSEITSGLWAAAPDGTVQTLALEGGTLTFDLLPVGIDQTGRVGILNNRRIYVATPGDVRPAAYTGLLNHASYTGSGAWVLLDAPNSTRILTLSPGGTLRVPAIAGTQAPGMPQGVTFKQFGEMRPSRSGENITFRAKLVGAGLDDTTAFSTFARVNGTTRLLSRPGLPAPGLGPDTLFDLFGTGLVNDRGQILLSSGLRGPGIDTSNDAAMWYDPGDGILRLLLREGDPFTFSGELRTLRTFESLMISSGGLGEDSFNDAGQFTCNLRFTDGSSGVFLFTIPEPAASGALVALALALPRRHDARRAVTGRRSVNEGMSCAAIERIPAEGVTRGGRKASVAGEGSERKCERRTTNSECARRTKGEMVCLS